MSTQSETNCYIYKIYCKDKSVKYIYIGSTKNDPKLRRNSHKYHLNKKINDTYIYTTKIYEKIRETGGWDNWTFEVIKEISTKNSDELLKEEKKICDTYKKDYELLNKQNIGTWSCLSDDGKKVFIKDYAQKEILCECGLTVLRGGLSKHKRSKKHYQLIDNEVGITFDRHMNRWRAYWKNNKGQYRTKSFSVTTHGDNARQKAKEYRKNMMSEKYNDEKPKS
jgi:hypothetical protein